MGKNPKSKPPVEDDELELEDEDEAEEPEEEDEDAEGEDEDGDDEPKAKKKGTGKGRGGHLVPREPTVVTKDILKAQKPEVQKLLKAREKAQAAGDKKALRKIRAGLRKEGFRLSKINNESED